MEYNKVTIINGLKMLRGFLNVFRLEEFVNLVDATIYYIDSYTKEEDAILYSR